MKILCSLTVLLVNSLAIADLTKIRTYKGFTANYFKIESVRVSVPKDRTLVGLMLYKDKATHDTNNKEILTHETCVLPNAEFLSKTALIDRVIAVCKGFKGASKE